MLKIQVFFCGTKCQTILSSLQANNIDLEKVETLQYLVYIVKDISHAKFSNPRHGVCLSTACLPIGEDTCWRTIFLGTIRPSLTH